MRETKKYLLILIPFGFLGIVASTGFAQAPGQVGGVYIEAPEQAHSPVITGKSLPIPPERRFVSPFPKLSAKAVLVKDVDSGFVLHEGGQDTRLPIASLTKLMTAIVVHKRFSGSELVTIEQTDVNTESFRADLVVGEKVSVDALLEATLISSANDAALALARFTSGNISKFVAEMNDEARLLGMNHTSFANPVGFDDPLHFSSAADLALLVEEFLRYPELLGVVSQKQATITSSDGQYHHLLRTTNKLLLKDSRILGLKTGYTAEAKGNLIILVAGTAESGAPRYYSILLGSNNRERESELVMNWIEENYKWN